MSKQNKINEQLITDLNNKDQAIVLQTIKKIRSIGSPEIIHSVLEKWIKSSGEVEHELTELLYTLKDKKVIEPLVESLDDDRFVKHRERIIQIFWNAGLNATEHLSTFVRIAAEGSFMECLECLTLIENLEPPFPEEEMMDSLLQLKNYFAKKNVEQEDKYELMRTIATIVKVTEEQEED